MKSTFADEYQTLFARLGYPLSKRSGLSEDQVARAEAKCGIRLPVALRDYYLMAGREKALNHAFNRLCMPSDWGVHSGKLVFMEENQTVVVWGVNATRRPTHDPSVFQAPLVDGEIDRWWVEHKSCSEFLKFMIHLQAAYGGGMPFTASAPATNSLPSKLKRRWQFGGEVNQMSAFSLERRVVCVAPWRGLNPSGKPRRVFAGATTKEDLVAIAEELELTWDRSP